MKQLLEEVIKSAGKLALEWFHRRHELVIHQKSSPKDIVSEADIAIEQFIKQQMQAHCPGFGFFGEESGKTEGTKGRWIVDPIDGTTNFTRGQYFWCVSIAIEQEGTLTLGAIYAPALDDFYIAEKGKGAYCNGDSIKVSDTSSLDEAVMATGFACLRAALESNNLARVNRISPTLSATRILGSAALDCCLVADGRLDAFWEQNLNLYDIAAGSLIAQEAGATVTDFQGNPTLNPKEIMMSNGKLHPLLLPLM